MDCIIYLQITPYCEVLLIKAERQTADRICKYNGYEYVRKMEEERERVLTHTELSMPSLPVNRLSLSLNVRRLLK